MEIETVCKPIASSSHQGKETNPLMFGTTLRTRLILEHGETVEEEITCPACKGILIDPKACSSCDQYYCQGCLTEILKTGGRCACGVTLRPKEAHKLVKKILSKYKFKCQFADQGCTEAVPYEQVLTHEKSCEYKPTKCEHEFCQAVVLKKDYVDHVMNCGFKKENCPFCLNLCLLCDLEFHQQNCEKRPAVCPGCHTKMFQIEYPNHVQTCELIQETCPECQNLLTRRDLKNHTRVNCVHDLLKKVNKEVNDDIGSLKQILMHLTKKLNEQESFFGIKCVTCEKFACEVSQRSCTGCHKNYCVPCSRSNMKNCKNCEAFICNRCRSSSEICSGCIRRKKAEKRNEVQNGRLSKLPNS